MARAVITKQTIVKPFGAVVAGGLDITFAAADAAEGNSFAVTGKELLIAYNSGASPYTITVDSVDDEKGRQEDITDYSLAAGDYAAISVGLTTAKGWMQGGVIHVDAEHADVLLAVLVLP